MSKPANRVRSQTWVTGARQDPWSVCMWLMVVDGANNCQKWHMWHALHKIFELMIWLIQHALYAWQANWLSENIMSRDIHVFVYLYLYFWVCICLSVFVSAFLNMYLCICIWMSRFHCSWNSCRLAPLASSQANVKATPPLAVHKVNSFVIFSSWNRVNPSKDIWPTKHRTIRIFSSLPICSDMVASTHFGRLWLYFTLDGSCPIIGRERKCLLFNPVGRRGMYWSCDGGDYCDCASPLSTRLLHKPTLRGNIFKGRYKYKYKYRYNNLNI